MFEKKATAIPGLFVLQLPGHIDSRGDFVKLYQRNLFSNVFKDFRIAEQYYSTSKQGVIRGLHFQTPPFAHDKIVTCIRGSAFDVVVDIRQGSPTYGKFQVFELNDHSFQSVFIPAGCAHGFCATAPSVCLFYSTSSEYNHTHDSGLLWNSLHIPWPCEEPILSERDKSFLPLAEFSSPFSFEGVPRC